MKYKKKNKFEIFLVTAIFPLMLWILWMFFCAIAPFNDNIKIFISNHFLYAIYIIIVMLYYYCYKYHVNLFICYIMSVFYISMCYISHMMLFVFSEGHYLSISDLMNYIFLMLVDKFCIIFIPSIILFIMYIIFLYFLKIFKNKYRSNVAKQSNDPV